MKISYVVPVYNCSSNLAITVESLLHQRIPHHQIILIDDGSTDDIEPLKRHYDGLVWVTNSVRKGAAYSRNVGNSMCTSDVIAVCDAGDYYTSNRSTEIMKFFSDPDNGLFYSDVQVNMPTGKPVLVQHAEPWKDQPKPPISHTTVAYRNPAPEYHERSIDTDLYEFMLYDCKLNGMKFGYVNKTLCQKLDLSSSPSYRDVKKAKDLKYEMYKEKKIEIERAYV